MMTIVEPLLNDRELLERFRDGDRAAFREFYDRHKSGLTLYVSSLVANSDTALEMLQDLFVHLYRNIERFIAADHTRAFLFGTAHHLAGKALRSGRRRQNLLKNALNNHLQPVPDETIGVFSDPVNLRKLSEALMMLPVDVREIIILHVYEKFTFQQLEDMKQTPLQTLYSRYRQGLQELRSRLQKMGVEEMDG